MNSGLTQIPKSLPATLPDVRSSNGRITVSTVPGNMVLRITITWKLELARSNCPISVMTRSIWPRPRLPLSLLGVPTQTRAISPSCSALTRVCNLPAPTTRPINASKPGSIIGLFPELMRETLTSCGSIPVTEWPISARHAAVTQPTYPMPKTVISISFLSRMTPGRFESGRFCQAGVKPGYFAGRRVPKLATVLAADVIEKRPVMAHRVFHWADGSLVETQIVGMHIQQSHAAMLSDPVQFSKPDFRRLLPQQDKERKILGKRVRNLDVALGVIAAD